MVVCLYRVQCSGVCRRWLSEVGPVLGGELMVPSDFGSVAAAVDAAVAAGWLVPNSLSQGIADVFCPACALDSVGDGSRA